MTDPWWGSHYLTPSYTYKTITAADPWLLTHAVANSDEGPSLMAASTLVHPRAPVRGRRSRCPEGRWAAGRTLRPVVSPTRRSASPSFGDNAVAACCRCQRQQQAKGSQSMRGRGGDGKRQTAALATCPTYTLTALTLTVSLKNLTTMI
jgi:hypothetical protein